MKIVHIAVAAAWFGCMLLIPRPRTALSDEGATHQLVARLTGGETLGIATRLGTLATGRLLAVLIDPGSARDGVWVGLGLVLAAIALVGIVARPARAI